MTHRTAYHEFTVAVVLQNCPWDNPAWRTWKPVTVRRPATFDINDREAMDAVVNEAFKSLEVTNEQLKNARETGRLERPVGGVIIGHSVIQEDVKEP